VLASQRRPAAIGLVLFPRSKPSAVTAQANRSSCSGTGAAAAAQKLGRSESFFYGDVFKADFPAYRPVHSLRFGAIGCVKWELSEFDG
jgi:hypothetical protein